jgi:hypothetical protein
MVQTARLDAELRDAGPCSVLWLQPEPASEGLAAVMAAASQLSGMTAAWGFMGDWERSKLLESWAEELSQVSPIAAEFAVGDTRMKAVMLTLPSPVASSPVARRFWNQFGLGMRPHKICGVLMPTEAQNPVMCGFAGLQLVLSAASIQLTGSPAARYARPGSTLRQTLLALEQAFLAEAVHAGGIAVTRLRAELLRPGIALTARRDVIREISAGLTEAEPIDPLLVERSRYLSGDW